MSKAFQSGLVDLTLSWLDDELEKAPSGAISYRDFNPEFLEEYLIRWDDFVKELSAKAGEKGLHIHDTSTSTGSIDEGNLKIWKRVEARRFSDE